MTESTAGTGAGEPMYEYPLSAIQKRNEEMMHLVRENAALREWLVRLGRHAHDTGCLAEVSLNPCSCGLAALLSVHPDGTQRP